MPFKYLIIIFHRTLHFDRQAITLSLHLSVLGHLVNSLSYIQDVFEAFTTAVASLDENRQDPPKPEVVVRMLVENIREVAYSVKKHRGGHNSVPGFEMDCPMGPEDCLKKAFTVGKN
jgi:hypothetical protein